MDIATPGESRNEHRGAPLKMNELAHVISVTRTLRLKVRRESYAWLNAAAIEVNPVWNWANEMSAKAAHPFAGRPNC